MTTRLSLDRVGARRCGSIQQVTNADLREVHYDPYDLSRVRAAQLTRHQPPDLRAGAVSAQATAVQTRLHHCGTVVFSLAQLVTSMISGRLSERVPARWLIGRGLLLVGIGLIVMAGLNGGSAWTHLIPGFIVAGLGGGLVNPPLASTVIGVVPPHKAGMASGVNNTFRQVGIATGIAALGSILTPVIQHHLSSALPPSLAGSAGSMANAVRQGSLGQLLASVPAADRGAVGAALHSSFAAALNELLYVAAGLAIVGAVCAVLLIRRKDFHRPADAKPVTIGRAAEEETGVVR